MKSIGVVIIGRNEGERLRRCLASVVGQGRCVVYVDSGSTDGSVELATKMGAEVVELDMDKPFTAARGRNAGFAKLKEMGTDVEYVQFIDGDCELIDGWLNEAEAFLRSHEKVAVICGRLRERYPEKSIYNRLCDIEWNGPVGEIDACGGIFMIRQKAFDEVGGMNETIVAGEEPEMCLRLRGRGWLITRLDQEMGWHDADMTRFSQWWKRAVRAGHAYAEGMARHGRSAERYNVRQSISQWVWAIGYPLLLLALAWPTYGWSLVGVLVYPLQVCRVALRFKRDGLPVKVAWFYAGSCVLAKWPQWQGQVRYWMRKICRKQATLIEYKSDVSSG